ncbi:hypothetical protein ABF87_13660 [Nitrosomonas sp. JL21]|uniref:beta strand repeat-containing protein n=1 Tax=Nitrosomonas sp. JL21 TaxID=153949 RepID=UPI001367FFB0|nr:hypothetical protein [Nitrosomonas sp. JL21]MBL8498582.1 hypothetical protein [Nitrosomonas sp.]MXS78984.1 hypothetical protein [Nitrosomonas sp. JL21]
MAITPEQRDDILKVTVGLFNGAPGNVYLPDLAAVIEGGASTEQLADLLAAHSLFKTSIIGGKVTTDEQVDVLLSHFGLAADDDPASPGSQAKEYFLAKLTAGEGFGKIVIDAINYLEGSPAEEFVSTATLLANKVKVAAAYSSQAGSTDLALLQTVLSKVTGDREYTPTDVQNALNESGVPTGSGQEFNLVIGEDNLTGTAGDDIFKALVTQDNNGAPVNSLESVDKLDGGAGTKDTLTATLSNDGATPLLANIENINVRFTSADTLDLNNATGVQAITVNSSTDVGTVSNIGDVADLSVRNQKQDTIFVGNTATSLNLDLAAFGDADVSNTVTLDDGATTLNLSASNAFATIAGLTSVETLNVAATGTNVVTQGSGGVTTAATITGTGSVELVTPFTVLETLTATENSGGVTATVNGAAVTVDGGTGNDDITYTAALAANAAVNLGAGDDSLTIAGISTAGATADAGEGTADTLAVTNGTWLNADAADVYSNFETLEIGGGQGVYDMENLPGLTAVTIGAALAGNADITNAVADATITVNAEAETDLVLGNDLTYALADATGTADAASLTLNALDGSDDTSADGLVFVDSFAADDIETFNIVSNISEADAEADSTDYFNTITALDGDAVETINVSGTAGLEITTLTAAALNKIDASTLTGALTVDASAADGVEFIGGAGNDVYTGTDGGDTITGNGGADNITLGTGAVDTIILNAATDSQLNATTDGHDIITGFGVAGQLDVIDVGVAGFTGQQASALANKGALANSAVDGSTLSVTDFFASGGQDRGVAIGTNGGSTFVFVDANKDGNFTSTDDAVVELAGVTGVTLANFGF